MHLKTSSKQAFQDRFVRELEKYKLKQSLKTMPHLLE